MREDDARIAAEAAQLHAAFMSGLLGKKPPKNGDRDMQHAWEVGVWASDLALAAQARLSRSHS